MLLKRQILKHSACYLDAPETTIGRKKVISSKPFLYNFYKDCYSFFVKAGEDAAEGPRLEIGSGAGFLDRHVSGLMRSDVLLIPDLDLVCSALHLPFRENALGVIYMLNVLHHIPDIALFFHEVRRCLKRGGKLIMVEPALTHWAEFIYKYFHYEEFDKTQISWKLPAGGPLSTANGALAWIVFERDRDIFVEKFPELIVENVEYVSPLTYLMSGGFTCMQLLPGSCYSSIKWIESILQPFNRAIGLFMRVSLVCRK
jgi:SAM-dependent methyltransferase